ncbi:CPBP family intramembrane metalloprotease [Glutamicibacter creatinolyticus]|uniref:CPBP family intramembrane metalloprotease n=1 Tax=Glutamicibacter creatinolyticus TaxID=162496 RepID=A0A5B7WWA7_9MICC|nr:MFS transporter [Glutamicibacter creatinolyticus]QCY48341.1 CPBP family intramembrane metalloprotease [Glutamicibacter creatinolyticus]
MLLALFASGLATFSQLYSVQGLLPEMSRNLNISEAQAALSVSAATLGLALAVIPWAIASDRMGRRQVIGIALVSSVVLGLAGAVSPSVELLLAARFLEGVALAGVPGTTLAYLAEELSARAVAIASGIYISGTTVGGLVGRLLAAWVAQPLGWRWGVAAVSLLAAAAMIVFFIKAPRAQGFTPVPDVHLRPVLRRFRASLQGRRPILYLQGFLLMGGFVAAYNYLAFRLEAPPFMIPPALAALVFLAYLAGTWSSMASGGIVNRVGRRTSLLLGTGVMMAGLLLTLSAVLWVIILGMLIFTAGFFAAHAVASGWVPVLAPETRAQAASLYNLGYYIGSSLFGWLLGIPFMHFGWSALVGCVVGLQLVAAAAAWFLRPPRQPQPVIERSTE